MYEFNSTAIQQRIRHWVTTRLGPGAMNPVERGCRQLEESLELAQALGVDEDKAQLLLAHVFGRPAGVVKQEIGGCMTTLLAAAESFRYSASTCCEDELTRVEGLPPERFFNRQVNNAAKGIGDMPETGTVTHGVNCPKIPHICSRTGWLHGEKDDGPYDVDGVLYCGRCHVFLNSVACAHVMQHAGNGGAYCAKCGHTEDV